MSKCRYCQRSLTDADIKWQSGEICGRCNSRRVLVRKFLEECEEFKKIINYEGILKYREAKRSDDA